VAFSRDGTLIATGNAGERAQLWRVADRSPYGKPIDITDDGVFAVAFSPDGRRFAAGGASTVRMWDVATHRLAAPLLKGHDGFVTGVAYDRQGRFLATTAFGATRLWDPETGMAYGDELEAAPVPASRQPELELLPPFLFIRNAFSPDGRFLVTSGADSHAMLWDLRLETWRTRACEIAGRNLTREEWRVYLPEGRPYRTTCKQWPAP
jgi:WD40 repeat protein